MWSLCRAQVQRLRWEEVGLLSYQREAFPRGLWVLVGGSFLASKPQFVPSSGLQLCCPSRTQPLVKGSEFRPEGPTCWFCPRQSFRGYLRRKVSRGVLRLECATEDWQWPLVCAHQADLQARQPMWGLSQSWSHQETCHLSPSSTWETASPHPYVPM